MGGSFEINQIFFFFFFPPEEEKKKRKFFLLINLWRGGLLRLIKYSSSSLLMKKKSSYFSFLLKTEIHTLMLNTQTFLSDAWEPRYLNKSESHYRSERKQFFGAEIIVKQNLILN